MKKKILIRCILGAPIGLAISTIITIIISITVGDGTFYPVVPELITKCGNEINAVVLQTICSFLYGAVWAGSTTIWEKEDWSILRQTTTHLIICSLTTLPIAYFTRWMPHNPVGILTYFGTFIIIYLIIWLSLYNSTRKRIKQLNQKIKEK